MPKTAQGKVRLSAQDKMSRVIDKLSNKFPKLSRSIRKASQSFRIAQIKSAKFTKSMSKMGSKMRGIGKGMAMGLTAPIVAFGALAIRTGVNFEKGMNKVSALTGATGKDLESMRTEAKKLGSTTQFSAVQAADAMAFFGQAGFDTNEILAATPATLALAAASSTDLATSADILSNVMGGFNVKADQAGKFANILALTTASGNVNMEMLAETMKDAAPVALKFGASIEETSALTAKLGDAGIQGSKAGTTLKNMFLKLAAPTSRIKKIMGELGVKVVDKTTGKMRKMTDILADMDKNFKGKGIKGAKKLAILNEIFGKRAIAGAGVLLDAVAKIDPKTGKASNSIAELTKKLESTKTAAADMAKTMQAGLGGAFTKLGSAFEGVQLSILDLEFGGKKLGQRVLELTEGLTEFLSKLSTTHTGLLKWIVVIAGVVAVIGPLLVIIGAMIAIIPSFMTGLALVKAGFIAMGIATNFAALPLLPITLGILAIVAAGVLLYKFWGPIKEFFSGFWDSFLDKIATVKNAITSVSSSVSGFFGFGDDDNKDKKSIVGSAAGAPTGAKEMLRSSSEKKQREREGKINVNFSNMPKGTAVDTENKSDIIGDLTGAMGAL